MTGITAPEGTFGSVTAYRAATAEGFCDNKHAIYASLSTGVRVRVSPFMSYDSAIRCFYEFDGGLAAGQCPQTGDDRYVVGQFAGYVRHFAVRSQADPDWPSTQPSHELSTAGKRDAQTVVDFLTGESNDLPFTVPSW